MGRYRDGHDFAVVSLDGLQYDRLERRGFVRLGTRAGKDRAGKCQGQDHTIEVQKHLQMRQVVPNYADQLSHRLRP